MQITRR